MPWSRRPIPGASMTPPVRSARDRRRPSVRDAPRPLTTQRPQARQRRRGSRRTPPRERPRSARGIAQRDRAGPQPAAEPEAQQPPGPGERRQRTTRRSSKATYSCRGPRRRPTRPSPCDTAALHVALRPRRITGAIRGPPWTEPAVDGAGALERLVAAHSRCGLKTGGVGQRPLPRAQVADRSARTKPFVCRFTSALRPTD